MRYTLKRLYPGTYHVLDEDGDRVARVGQFMPGPMVSYDGPGLMPPAMARVVARALVRLAKDIEAEAA